VATAGRVDAATGRRSAGHRLSAYLLTSNIELRACSMRRSVGCRSNQCLPWYEPEGVPAMLGKLTDLSHTVSDTGAFGLPAVDAEFAPLRYTA
jgi:hypothetical protein